MGTLVALQSMLEDVVACWRQTILFDELEAMAESFG